MKKFLNRPFLALAAALGFVFLVILVRMYVSVIDRLSNSLMVNEYHRGGSIKFDGQAKESDSTAPSTAVIVGPQLPYKYEPTQPMRATNAEITLGYNACFFFSHIFHHFKGVLLNIFSHLYCIPLPMFLEHLKRSPKHVFSKRGSNMLHFVADPMSLKISRNWSKNIHTKRIVIAPKSIHFETFWIIVTGVF